MQGFKTESKAILDLMINSIYTNHEVFLRELISNASDACDKVRLAAGDGRQEAEGLPATGELGIHLAFDREARELTVSDTGIGMDAADLERCLGTIAHSGSAEVRRALEAGKAGGAARAEVDIIGQFGVGFYSAFMVADHVRVVSRALGSDQAFAWESDGVEGYTVLPAERPSHGTDVILHIRPSTCDENLERYLDQSSLVGLVRRYSNYIRYPITMDLAAESFDAQGALVRDESQMSRQVVNSMTPIWAQPEEDVGQAELEEFFRFEFRDPQAPLRCIRAHARGAIEYDALLFVPAQADPELYSKDFRYGLKLYSAGVLIDEACAALLPSHLRFVQGVVDTRNIRLNVSRESIQEDGRIQIIARQLERSVLEGLKDMMAHDRPAYERLFEQYGTGFRFAICASRGDLTNVLHDLLLYRSARHDRLISLQEYLDEAGDAKGAQVFYAAGSNVERLKASPAVQALLRQGHDVLLCPHGAQDEFCLMTMGTYKGAGFHSAASANLDVAGAACAQAAGPGEDGPLQETLTRLGEHSPVPLVRVVASSLLTAPDEAASRVATEDLMTISMAKYVSSRLGEGKAPGPLYVLEVNTSGPVFALARHAAASDDAPLLDACATALVGMAFLAEDIPLPDPAAFNRSVCTLLRQSPEGAAMP